MYFIESAGTPFSREMANALYIAVQKFGISKIWMFLKKSLLLIKAESIWSENTEQNFNFVKYYCNIN